MSTTTATHSYKNFEDPLWSLDSMEGVPDTIGALKPAAAKQAAPKTSPANAAFEWLGSILPGVTLAFAMAWIGYQVSEIIGAKLKYDPGKSPISPITIAVILGLAIRNTIGVPKTFDPGLRLCVKTILRLGIVVLGLTLTIKAIGHDVIAGLPVILCCITAALLIVTFINRALGLPKRLGTLIAVGTSICGVSAIVATAPIIEAEEDETAYAVACITVFGLIALLTYPFLAHHIFDPAHPVEAGTFLGTAIHDTSQVAGASAAYAQQYTAPIAAKTAITVKLVRNLCMSLLIPLMAILYRRSESKASGKKVKQSLAQVLPLFVVMFFVMACIRSIGDATGGTANAAFGFIPHAKWFGTGHHDSLDDYAKYYALWLLATALGGVGLGTGLAKLKGLGLKPFSVGLVAALLVGGVSFSLIKLLAAMGKM